MTKIVVPIVATAAILGLAPFGIKTLSDKIIDEKVNELRTNGIELKITNSKGYLESKRDFVLTIKDEDKFKYLVKQSLLSKYPAYEHLIEEIFASDSKEFDSFLKGIVFKGDISNSNINLNSDIKVNTYLDKFSDEIMDAIKKDEESKKIIIPFLEKQGFLVNMTYSNKGELKNLRLKDINEEIKTRDSIGRDVSSSVKLLGYEVVNKSNSERVIADINLKDFILEVKSKDDSKISLNNLDYSINYKNELENAGVLTFDKFNFTNNKDGITLGKTTVSAKGEAFTNSYSSSVVFNTNNLHANTPKGDIDIDNLVFKINADNIDYEALKKLNSSYIKFQSYSANPNMKRFERKEAFEKVAKPMLDSINRLINQGLLLDLKVDLKNFKNDNLNLKSVVIDLNGTLNKNDINVKFLNNQSLLKEIDANINISMFKEDMENIFQIIPPQVGMLLSVYAKEKNDKIVYDIELNKGKVLVNGKNLN